MNHARPRCLAAVVLAALLAGCGEPGNEKPRSVLEGAAGWNPAASPAGATADAATLAAVSRRLAGLEPGGDPAWTLHAARMEELWREIEQRHLAGMRAWSETVLAPLVPEGDLPLFYPFGGPDFLSAWLFFPDAPTTVLVGLEPPGRLPVLAGDAPEAALERQRNGFESLVEAGYFQQTDMDRDLADSSLDGVLPVLFILLVRTGHRVIAVRHVDLDVHGRLTEPATATASAVAIDYARTGEDDTRRLLYFARDLSDASFAGERPELARYLAAHGPWNVFMKSAVYLLHMEGFKALADLLLAESRTLLQDDSGLPHRLLDPEAWDLYYFGAYTRTLPVYRKWFQEDLRVAFAEGSGVRPLGFAVGYHSQIGEGCLILANRRTAP